jgi:hypothetical protein
VSAVLQFADADAETSWDEALSRAVSGVAGGEGILLAFELREDLSVEAATPDAEPLARWSLVRGLSSRGPFERGRELHRSDPVPDDALPLLAAALDPPGPPGPTRAGNPAHDGTVSPALSSAGAGRVVGGLVSSTARLVPDATVAARWVGFVQRVLLARPGRPLARDVRCGARVRLEARRCGALAVGEAVLPPEGSWTDRFETLSTSVARRLEERSDARELASGQYPVVFAPGVGGVLVHEVVGHALEADVVQADLSWLSRGPCRIATPELVVVDDPRRGRASWRVDDEGEPSRPVPLIRGGRVAGRLLDLRSAVRSGRAPSGHGRRASFRDPVRPRMGCTFVGPGSSDPEEVLEGIGSGIYVRRMEVASTDPRTGDAVFRVTDADRITRGRLAGTLTPHLLRIDGRAALATMDRIASDIAFDTCIGTCIRDGQALVTSVGGPTFRIGLTDVLF